MPEDAGRIDAARLVDDHLAAVYRYAYRLCGSAADAEDLTQDVFLAAQRKLGQLRNLDSARAWLYSILRNCFLKTRSRPAPVPAASLQLNLGSIPEEPTERAEIDQERLEQALAELPENFRIVL
jgi:RNA polymerase sigma-70 factor (ECF subfamily)